MEHLCRDAGLPRGQGEQPLYRACIPVVQCPLFTPSHSCASLLHIARFLSITISSCLVPERCLSAQHAQHPQAAMRI